MRLIAVFALVLISAPFSHAQMSSDQKSVDFQQLAALFAKRYSFVEWKKLAVNYDILDISNWVERARNSKDDLEYMEVCSEYIANLQDGHTGFHVQSTFFAGLPIEVDYVEDRVVIDVIDRKAL